MPVQIGARPEANFTDPIGLMTDCHRRIERFLGILLRIAHEVAGRSLREDQKVALRTALQYFREAAPRHTADEEDSLFPYLRAQAGSARELHPVLQQIDELESDHVQADVAHQRIDQLGAKWLEKGRLSTGEAAQMAELLQDLESRYRAHIAVEEGSVFPVARRFLTLAARQRMAGELARRRGVAAVTKL